MSSLTNGTHQPNHQNLKTLGLLGGMTYHATSLYYNMINQHVNQRLGGVNAAKILLHSFNFHDTSSLFTTNQWSEATELFTSSCLNLQRAGADAIIMCVNTGHKVADQVSAEIGIPLLHIADFVGEAVRAKELKKVALLGTKPVMEEDFIVGRLRNKFNLEVIVPESSETRQKIHDVIFRDLGNKIVTDETKTMFLDVVAQLKREGAEGLVLACTELQFVIRPEDVDGLPLFDTVELHAKGAAEWAVSSD